MRLLIKELFTPIKDFYKISEKNERFKNYIIPFIVGIVYIISAICIDASLDFNILNFGNDFINTTITVITLLITFNMAYLTILVTGDNDNIKMLKSRVSKRTLGREPVLLYQVMLINISYTTIVEVIFLVFIFSQKFFIYVIEKKLIHLILAIDLVILSHILLMLLQIIVCIYFSFWKIESIS